MKGYLIPSVLYCINAVQYRCRIRNDRLKNETSRELCGPLLNGFSKRLVLAQESGKNELEDIRDSSSGS